MPTNQHSPMQAIMGVAHEKLNFKVNRFGAKGWYIATAANNGCEIMPDGPINVQVETSDEFISERIGACLLIRPSRIRIDAGMSKDRENLNTFPRHVKKSPLS